MLQRARGWADVNGRGAGLFMMACALARSTSDEIRRDNDTQVATASFVSRWIAPAKWLVVSQQSRRTSSSLFTSIAGSRSRWKRIC